MPDEDWVTARELGQWLHIAEHTLAQWRYRRQGPTYTKVGGRVLYRRADVKQWLANRTVKTT
jgi:hypothetical protein